MTRAAWLARLARAEGVGGVAARAADRWREQARRRSFRRAREPLPSSWPVLVVSSAAPVARLGGVQAQLAARLAATVAPWALLYPEAGGYRLELVHGAERSVLVRRAAAPRCPPALHDDAFEHAVRWAVAATGARALHVEGTADLPLGALARLTRTPLALVLAVHDFSLFCVRAHLLETTTERFCGWCRDPGRCRRCLRDDGRALDVAHLAERRALGHELLARAAAVMFPSAFVCDHYAELFSPTASVPWRVIPPAVPAAAPYAPRRARPAATPHVAFVGTAAIHKGAAVFTEVVRAMGGRGRARFSAYGGGDPATLAAWRRLGVHVRGYYRTGTLPARLARDAVDVAVLPSVVPESHSLVLGECRRAGVPVVAFDFGAVAERVRAAGDGRLVPPAQGAAGLAEAVWAVLREGVAARLPVADDMGEPGAVAAAWAALYAELGLAAEPTC